MNRNNEPRTLTQICENDDNGFSKELNGVTYCGIRITQAGVHCPYRAKNEDHNGLYRCNNLRYIPAINNYKN